MSTSALPHNSSDDFTVSRMSAVESPSSLASSLQTSQLATRESSREFGLRQRYSGKRDHHWPFAIRDCEALAVYV